MKKNILIALLFSCLIGVHQGMISARQEPISLDREGYEKGIQKAIQAAYDKERAKIKFLKETYPDEFLNYQVPDFNQFSDGYRALVKEYTDNFLASEQIPWTPLSSRLVDLGTKKELGAFEEGAYSALSNIYGRLLVWGIKNSHKTLTLNRVTTIMDAVERAYSRELFLLKNLKKRLPDQYISVTEPDYDLFSRVYIQTINFYNETFENSDMIFKTPEVVDSITFLLKNPPPIDGQNEPSRAIYQAFFDIDQKLIIWGQGGPSSE